MTRAYKRAYTEEDVGLVRALSENLAELHRIYLAAREHIIFEVLAQQLRHCDKCERIMLPRRLWDRVPLDVRAHLRKHITRAGASNLCGACVVYKHRNRTLNDKTLLKLRRQVGLVP